MGGEAFKALADPTRRHILELLRTKDLTAGEIARRNRRALRHDQAFAQPPSEHPQNGRPGRRRTRRPKHHLQPEHLGPAVDAERDGQNIIYSLNTSVMQDLMSWVYTFTDRSEDHER